MKSLILFPVLLILTLHCCFISGQQIKNHGIPFIKSFSPEEYRASPQNWAVCQDNRGMMFFGNTDGLLEYDGISWKINKFGNKSTCRSLLKATDGKIYYGAQDEFGYLISDSAGKIAFHSLLGLIPDSMRHFNDVWKLYQVDDNIVFFTAEHVFIYNGHEIKTISTDKEFHMAYSINHKLYIRKWGAGLGVIENDSFKLVPGGEQFANERIYSMLAWSENEILVSTRKLGFFIFDGKSFKPFKTENDDWILKAQIYYGMKIGEEYFAYGTNFNGLFITDKKGKIILHVNKENGLADNTVYYLMTDRAGNLWAAHATGISYIEINSPFTRYGKEYGLNSKIYISTFFKNQLIAGGDVLLFAKEWEQSENPLNRQQFTGLDKTEGQSWLIKPVKDKLLVAHNPGLLLIDGKNVNEIKYENYNVWTFVPLKQHPGKLFVGIIDGIILFEEKSGSYQPLWKIKGFDNPARYISPIDDQNLWVSVQTNGIFRLTLNPELDSVIAIKHYNTQNGLPFDAANIGTLIGDKLVVATPNKFYHYNPITDRFELFDAFNRHLGKFEEININTIDPDGKVWFTNEEGPGYFLPAAKDSFTVFRTPFFKFAGMKQLNQITKINDNEFIIGTNPGFIHYDASFKKDYQQKYATLLRKVELIGSDSLIFGGNFPLNADTFSMDQPEDQKMVFKYRNNSLRFVFASAFYEDAGKIQYQYKLENYDEQWSNWSRETKKEYTRLPEGDYIFRVKAKNIYRVTGDESSFRFSINPPWYRTYLVYGFYLVLIIFAVFIVVRISLLRLRKANLYLEKLVQKRTYEINQQKEELLSQAEELRAQREELEKANQELEKLSIVARETDNAVVIMDGKGNFEWVNEGFTNLYNLTFSEFITKRGSNIFECTSSPEIMEELNRCVREKVTVYYEFFYHTPNNKKVWAKTTITPIVDENGNVIKLVAIDSDITDLKIAEAEILQHKTEIEAQRDFALQQKELIEQQNTELEKHRSNLEQLVRERTAELEIAKDRAEESDRLKSAFLANMSHEIRTPMNAIIGFSSLLIDEEVSDEEKKEYIRRIIQNGSSLMHLIDDIVNVSIIEAGQLKMFKQNVNVNKLFQELVQTYTVKLKNSKDQQVEIRHSIADIDKPMMLFTDGSRLQQILTNLIDNAIKYTEKGTVTLGYDKVFHDTDPAIRFYVKDTGVGMTEKQKSKLFERFSKADESKEKLYRGAGLGLSLCKNLVELLGGHIWADSEQNVGSTFYFILPFETTVESVSMADHLKNGVSSGILDGKTILIAEDEESNYKLLEAILLKTNTRILHANNGLEAVEMVKNNHVDLILMDVKMPVMNGLEATKIIKGMGLNIPIIAQTAFAFESDEITTYHSGCDAYISKPIHRPKLIDLITQLMK